MARIRSRNTKPEIIVRWIVRQTRYRYQTCKCNLPGRPDIVFAKRKKAILVNGCFWHGHACKAGFNRPMSNKEYWLPKLKRNKLRDKENLRELKKMGWEVLVVWECELKNVDSLKRRVLRFLQSK